MNITNQMQGVDPPPLQKNARHKTNTSLQEMQLTEHLTCQQQDMVFRFDAIWSNKSTISACMSLDVIG